MCAGRLWFYLIFFFFFRFGVFARRCFCCSRRQMSVTRPRTGTNHIHTIKSVILSIYSSSGAAESGFLAGGLSATQLYNSLRCNIHSLCKCILYRRDGNPDIFRQMENSTKVYRRPFSLLWFVFFKLFFVSLYMGRGGQQGGGALHLYGRCLSSGQTTIEIDSEWPNGGI